MPEKKNDKEQKPALTVVPQSGAPQRIYSNFVHIVSGENETQLTFCDLEPLSKEQVELISKEKAGVHEVPVVVRIVLPHGVAKKVGEILLEQAKGREGGQPKDDKKL